MPYKSDAQRKFFNVNRSKLESQGVNVDEWNSSSRGKKLPSRVRPAAQKCAHVLKAADQFLSKQAGLAEWANSLPVVQNARNSASEMAIAAEKKLAEGAGFLTGQARGQRIGGGAGAGLLAGAGVGLMQDPGVDPETGKRRSRLRRALLGALGGAGIGALTSTALPFGNAIGGQIGGNIGAATASRNFKPSEFSQSLAVKQAGLAAAVGKKVLPYAVTGGVGAGVGGYLGHQSGYNQGTVTGNQESIQNLYRGLYDVMQQGANSKTDLSKVLNLKMPRAAGVSNPAVAAPPPAPAAAPLGVATANLSKNMPLAPGKTASDRSLGDRLLRAAEKKAGTLNDLAWSAQQVGNLVQNPRIAYDPSSAAKAIGVTGGAVMGGLAGAGAGAGVYGLRRLFSGKDDKKKPSLLSHLATGAGLGGAAGGIGMAGMTHGHSMGARNQRNIDDVTGILGPTEYAKLVDKIKNDQGLRMGFRLPEKQSSEKQAFIPRGQMEVPGKEHPAHVGLPRDMKMGDTVLGGMINTIVPGSLPGGLLFPGPGLSIPSATSGFMTGGSALLGRKSGISAGAPGVAPTPPANVGTSTHQNQLAGNSALLTGIQKLGPISTVGNVNGNAGMGVKNV